MNPSGASNFPQEVAGRMEELGRRYLDRTAGEIEPLRALVGRVCDNDGEVFRDIEVMAHRIRGSGAMFGFELVSDVAGEIELLSVDAKLGYQPDRLALQARFAALLRVLEFVVKAAR